MNTLPSYKDKWIFCQDHVCEYCDKIQIGKDLDVVTSCESCHRSFVE